MLKPATHQDTPIAANLIDSENHFRFSPPINADTLGDFFFAHRGDVAVSKSHDIKLPNLMGWLYWRFAVMSVGNRGNRHTWRMPANLNADIWHARYRRFYKPIAAKFAIAAPGTPGDFRPPAYKIAKCVTGLRGGWCLFLWKAQRKTYAAPPPPPPQHSKSLLPRKERKVFNRTSKLASLVGRCFLQFPLCQNDKSREPAYWNWNWNWNWNHSKCTTTALSKGKTLLTN